MGYVRIIFLSLPRILFIIVTGLHLILEMLNICITAETQLYYNSFLTVASEWNNLPGPGFYCIKR